MAILEKISSHFTQRSNNAYVQNYTDKAYRAVIAANKKQEEYKYHLAGGAAGTVSPSKLYLFSVDMGILLLSNH